MWILRRIWLGWRGLGGEGGTVWLGVRLTQQGILREEDAN